MKNIYPLPHNLTMKMRATRAFSQEYTDTEFSILDGTTVIYNGTSFLNMQELSVKVKEDVLYAISLYDSFRGIGKKEEFSDFARAVKDLSVVALVVLKHFVKRGD